MVKTIYLCEICGSNYDKKGKALECESQGKLTQGFPVGTIFGIDGYKDMVFVICGFIQERHHAHYRAWGFRDTDAGDNAPETLEEVANPKNTCGFTQYNKEEGIVGAIAPDKKLDCYTRAIETMKKFGIVSIDYPKDVRK